MYNDNPNASPPALRSFDRSPMQYGYPNPYHFGQERVQGQLAPQGVRDGLPTNGYFPPTVNMQDNAWRQTAQTPSSTDMFGQTYTADQQTAYQNALRPAGATKQFTNYGYTAPATPGTTPAVNPAGAPTLGNTPAGTQAATAADFAPHRGWGNNPNAQPTLIEQWAQTPAGQAFLSQPQHFVSSGGEWLDQSNIKAPGYGYGGHGGPFMGGMGTMPSYIQNALALRAPLGGMTSTGGAGQGGV